MTSRQRTRDPEERKKQIIDAAVQCFAERGYERTTTKEIAAAAGIAEGTIYKYFASKQDLLFAFVEGQVLEPLVTLFAEVDATDDETVIRTFVENRFALWDRSAPLIKVVFSEACYNPQLASLYFRKVAQPALKLLESYFTKRMQAGKFRNINPANAARALVGLVLSHFIFWEVLARGKAPLPAREELVHDLTRLFLYGIINPNDTMSCTTQ